MPERTAVGFDFKKAAMEGNGVAPFGANNTMFGVDNGMCMSDSEHFGDADVEKLATCALDAYDRHIDAHFFWNFRNEIEARWSYTVAYDKGWINRSAKNAHHKASSLEFLQ